jgi:ArsR family transcriptional regulator
MCPIVNLISIHECLCDRTRLRIVHLLLRGPLCVCHLEHALGEPQAKISRHLAYLRRNRMVRLPARRPQLLEANLACLQDCAAEEPVFRRDLQRLSKIRDVARL